MVEKEQSGKTLFRGELALVIAVLVNSFGVVLMLYSGAGISAISSVPFAFSLSVWPGAHAGHLDLPVPGVPWLLSLMLLRRKWLCPATCSALWWALYSASCWMCTKLWINVLPYNTAHGGWCILWSATCLICLGIALSNRCELPIVPTDLFPAGAGGHYQACRTRDIKIGFDVTCLASYGGHDAASSWAAWKGLGIGTIAAAFTMGKGIGLVGDLLDKHFYFENYKTLRTAKNKQ